MSQSKRDGSLRDLHRARIEREESKRRQAGEHSSILTSAPDRGGEVCRRGRQLDDGGADRKRARCQEVSGTLTRVRRERYTSNILTRTGLSGAGLAFFPASEISRAGWEGKVGEGGVR